MSEGKSFDEFFSTDGSVRVFVEFSEHLGKRIVLFFFKQLTGNEGEDGVLELLVCLKLFEVFDCL